MKNLKHGFPDLKSSNISPDPKVPFTDKIKRELRSEQGTRSTSSLSKAQNEHSDVILKKNQSQSIFSSAFHSVQEKPNERASGINPQSADNRRRTNNLSQISRFSPISLTSGTQNEYYQGGLSRLISAKGYIQNNNFMIPEKGSLKGEELLKAARNAKNASLPTFNDLFHKPQTTTGSLNLKIDPQQYLSKLNPEMPIHSFTVADGVDLYRAKCLDNSVPEMPLQAWRFLKKFNESTRHRKLSLIDMGLRTQTALKLNSLLKNDREVTYLNLQKNVLGNMGLIILSEAICKTDTLVYLNLQSNDIGPEGAQALFGALFYNHSIVSIDLSSLEGLNRNRLTKKGAEPLETLLASNQVLQLLNLSGTNLGCDGVGHILKGLTKNNSLFWLDISNNYISFKNADLLAKALISCKLTSLNLSNNKIGDIGAEKISGAIGKNLSVLESLNLSENSITSHGAAWLFEGLNKNICLTELILDKNNFNGKEFGSVSKMLQENPTLHVLGLGSCKIDEDGGLALGAGLAKNIGLIKLNLENNRLKDHGASAIARGLAFNAKLKHLDISRNKLRDDAAVLFGDVIGHHPKLEEFFAKENKISDTGGVPIVEGVRKNQRLMKVGMDYNLISYKYLLEITKSVDNNVELKRRQEIPQFIKAVEDLKRFQELKMIVEKESQELSKKNLSMKEELEMHKSMVNTKRQEDLVRGEEMEKALLDANLSVQQQEKNSKVIESELKKEIFGIEDDIREKINELGDLNHDIQQLERDLRSQKELQQVRKHQLENKIEDLKMMLSQQTRKLHVTQQGYEMFLIDVQRTRENIKKLEDEEQMDLLDDEYSRNEEGIKGKKLKKKVALVKNLNKVTGNKSKLSKGSSVFQKKNSKKKNTEESKT